MATRTVLTPLSAEFPSTNFPQLTSIHSTARRPVLAFDATTSEACHWTGVAPAGLTGALTAVVSYCMASATSGGVAWDVSLEAITDNDATDLDAAESFASVNTGTATVPGTAGYIDQVSITLTNDDSLVAADYFRIKLSRQVAHASDTATGDALCLAVEFRDAA